MEIKQVNINHMQNPIGFKLDELVINCELTGSVYPDELQKKLIIRVKDQVIYQTEWLIANDLEFKPLFKLEARTHYDVEILLKDSQSKYSKAAYFETGLLNHFDKAQWIGTDDRSYHSLRLAKRFNTTNHIQDAHLYISGLGVFEAYLDGEKIGNEYLTPGFTNYNYYTQIETYPLTEQLQTPGEHTLTIILGDGWYRGKIGIKEHGGTANQYGQDLMTCAELYYTDADGQESVIATDDTWQITNTNIIHSGIYYGEDLDDTIKTKKLALKNFPQPSKYTLDRLSLPITAHEKIAVVEKIVTNSNAVILDFGQNMAGWVTFNNHLPKGNKIELQYGEVMQNGELYRKNLRSARATFTYVSDGSRQLIRPHFTYFGFRYVKLIGFPENINLEDFKAVALYSDMPEIGNIKTNRSDVNRLFENVKWGQKSNFVDIPTDCPQRDERLGWTGDAAIFAKTASYNMNTFQFNKKFSFDIAVEQSLKKGMVPLYCPAIDEQDGGKAVWSDAATIIPWTTYLQTQDDAVLRQNFGR